jgi:hypothetical protein
LPRQSSLQSRQQQPQLLQKDEINLHDILYTSGGILRISTNSNSNEYKLIDDDDSFTSINLAYIRNLALSSMCDCDTIFSPSHSLMSTAGLEEETNNSNINDKDSISKEKDVRQISLLDGSVRRTLATATIGFPYNNNNNKGDNDDDDDKEQDAIVGGALELPTWIDTACHSSTTNNDDTTVVTTTVRDSFDELRDAVAYIVNLFVTKLDTELASSSMTAACTNNNNEDKLRYYLVETTDDDETQYRASHLRGEG